MTSDRGWTRGESRKLTRRGMAELKTGQAYLYPEHGDSYCKIGVVRLQSCSELRVPIVDSRTHEFVVCLEDVAEVMEVVASGERS